MPTNLPESPLFVQLPVRKSQPNFPNWPEQIIRSWFFPAMGSTRNRSRPRYCNCGPIFSSMRSNCIVAPSGEQLYLMHVERGLNYKVPRRMLVEASLEHFKASLDVRQLSDEQIMRCSEGMVKMYGCKIGEASHDEPDEGGYFSIALLNAAKRLSASDGSIITVHGAFMDAKRFVSEFSGGEQPPGYFSRTLPHFPFAVSL